MSYEVPPTWYYNNGYNAEAAREHFNGVVHHEPWCISLDGSVYYVYEIVVDPSKLTIGDAFILHALGVTWTDN